MLAALQDTEREGRAQRGPSCHAGLSSQPQEEAVCDPRCQHFTHSAALGAEPTAGTEPRAGVGNRQDAIAALQGLRSAGEMAKSIDTWMMETTEPCRQHKNVLGMKFSSHRKQIPRASFSHSFIQSINQQAPIMCQALFVSVNGRLRRDKTPCPQDAPTAWTICYQVLVSQRNCFGFFLVENFLL